MKSRIAAALVCCLALGSQVTRADDEKGGDQILVGTIIDVEYAIEKKIPPNLLVTATGEVPTTGYTNPILSRAIYKQPPEDGIQDYFLTAKTPTGGYANVISQVKASSRWEDYESHAPWLKGIRIHGVGDGVVVVMLEGANHSASTRDFVGTANDGSVENAIADAVAQLKKSLNEGSAADAMATWEVQSVRGTTGGIANMNRVEVTIRAERTPPWPTP